MISVAELNGKTTEDATAPGNLIPLLRFTKNLGYARVVDRYWPLIDQDLLPDRDGIWEASSPFKTTFSTSRANRRG